MVWSWRKVVGEVVVGAVALISEERCDMRCFALYFGEEENVGR